MSKDSVLKDYADRLSALVTKIDSLRKEFNKLNGQMIDDSVYNYNDRFCKFRYVTDELMAPAAQVLDEDLEFAQGLLSDAQEILQIESGYEATKSTPEDLLGGKKVMSEIELKKQELERRREAGLKFAASKEQIVAPLFVDTDDEDAEPTEEPETKVRSFYEIQGEFSRKAAEANKLIADICRKNFEFKPN